MKKLFRVLVVPLVAVVVVFSVACSAESVPAPRFAPANADAIVYVNPSVFVSSALYKALVKEMPDENKECEKQLKKYNLTLSDLTDAQYCLFFNIDELLAAFKAPSGEGNLVISGVASFKEEKARDVLKAINDLATEDGKKQLMREKIAGHAALTFKSSEMMNPSFKIMESSKKMLQMVVTSPKSFDSALNAPMMPGKNPLADGIDIQAALSIAMDANRIRGELKALTGMIPKTVVDTVESLTLNVSFLPEKLQLSLSLRFSHEDGAKAAGTFWDENLNPIIQKNLKELSMEKLPEYAGASSGKNFMFSVLIDNTEIVKQSSMAKGMFGGGKGKPLGDENTLIGTDDNAEEE